MKPISHVLIIDDHPLFREGLKSLLEKLDPQVAVLQANNLDDARQYATDPVGLVLLDWFMPGVHGQEALTQIRALFEDASVVVMSGEESPQTVWAAIELGASGYIPKSTDTNMTIHALRLVLSSGIYLPPVAIGAGSIRSHDPAPVLATPAPLSKGSGGFLPETWNETLSPRQKEVLHCVLQGKPNKIIAREICIAEGTVKAHLWAVFQLLGVKNRVEAMRLAYDLKLVE